MGTHKTKSYSGRFRHIHTYPGIIRHIPAYSGIIRDIQEFNQAYSEPCVTMVIQNSSIFSIKGIFRTLSKIINDNYLHKL